MKRFCRLAFLIFAGVSSISAQTSSRPLSAGEIAKSSTRLPSSSIPGLVGHPRVDPRQSFAVSAPGTPGFWIEPVRYRLTSPETGQPQSRCGIFVLPEAGSAIFVGTVGYGQTEPETCTQLLGLGFADWTNGMPRILLLYAAASPNFSTREPVVLDWNSGGKRYEVNAKLSERLTHGNNARSISAMKHALAAQIGSAK